jgi:photosystem II stability/assembly factor-like uncharacterized protein
MRWLLFGGVQTRLSIGGVFLAWFLIAGLTGFASDLQGDLASAFLIQDFDPLSGKDGWIWFGERLFRTTAGGKSWQEITPPLSSGLQLAAVDFLNAEHGWAILTKRSTEAENTLYLARTFNGGQSWQIDPIPLDEEDRFLPIARHFLTVQDANTIWLVQKVVSSANFSVGILYRTSDGGHTWQRLELPIAAPIQKDDGGNLWMRGGAKGDEVYRSTDGGVTWSGVTQIPNLSQKLSEDGLPELHMVSDTMGWKLERKGNCESQTVHPSFDGTSRQSLRCRVMERLWSTEDGGRSWAVVPLPNGQTYLVREESVDTAWFASPTAPQPLGEEVPETPLIAVMQGQAFDKCEIPTLEQLTTWKAHSPYRAVNVYIGGVHRACPNTALTPEFIAQLRQQGWGLIPTWVGLQARCTTYQYRMSKYPPKAYQEGRKEAEAATLAAQQLGLTNSAGHGSVIYYDLEHYEVRNEECNQAARAFINGWVERMTELGMIGGVYSTGRPLSQFVDLPNSPPVIWAAHWIADSYDPEATVWDVSGLSNEWWKDRQRLRQYAGGHKETWGDVQLNIDSNVMDGIVSFHFYIPSGLDYQYYFPLIAR